MTKNKGVIGSLRVVASFALLGAVIAGVLLGWVEGPVDFRVVGAVAGATVPFVAKMVHFA